MMAANGRPNQRTGFWGKDRKRVPEAPLVSAVVPAFNAATHIQETLRSLVNQTYPNLEIVVVNDGSEDATVRRIQSMRSEYPQIRLIQQPNLGVAAARNRGIQASQGELIAPVDADDIWFPHAVEKLADCLLNSDPGVGVAYGWWVSIDHDGLLDGGFRCSTIEGDVLSTLVCHNFLGNASSTMIRRGCFERVGGYTPEFRAQGAQGCEDWDLYLRLARQYQFRVVPEFLFGYRRFRGSMSSNPESMARSHRYLLEQVNQRHPRTPRAFCRLSTSSFYLYLARECHRHRQPYQSFSWLRQALVGGPIFTLARVAFYDLTAKNTAAIFQTVVRRLSRLIGRRAGRHRTSAPARSRLIRVTDVERRRMHIRLKNLIQTVFHRAVSRVPIS